VEIDHTLMDFGAGAPRVFAARFQAQAAGVDADVELAEAVALAAGADAAIVFVGTTEEVESEGFDRATLDLPGRQDELVTRVAAANPNTVVVVTSGGPVLLPWRETVPAILVAGYLGQETGDAIADVLTGRVEPTGRAPVTWPAGADQALDPTPVGGRLRYAESVLIGHRGYRARGATPAYWFGFGIGWTTWSYEELSATAEPAGGAITARVRLRNTGARDGTEVVQVYAAYPDEPAARFAGSARVTARPGETATALVAVPARVLRRFDGERLAPRSAPVVLFAGPHAGDLPLRWST
jgi:beta-glucosidase